MGTNVNPISRESRAIACAIQFLTRIPVATKTSFTGEDYANSLFWYPLVGILIGVLLLLSSFLVVNNISEVLGAALILALWVAVTGGLHLDGVADCADAWIGGSGDRGRTFRILKDPRSGPIAVVVLVLILLLKLTALTALFTAKYWPVIGLIPVLARAALPLIFWRFRYVSVGGLGSALAADLSVRRVIVCLLLVSIAATAVLINQLVILALFAVLALLIVLWWQRTCYQKLGGFNGDCAGALVELLELGLLLGLAILYGSNP